MCALCSLYIVGFRYFCLVTFGLCGPSDWLTTLPILKGFWSFFRKLWGCLLKGKGLDCLSIFFEELFIFPQGKGSLEQLDMAHIPMETNQGTLPKGDPCAFPFFGNVGTPLMATLNIPGLNVGLPVWLWSTPNIPNALEASQMNALFQGHQMGANCSSSFKEKSGIPSSPPSCKKKSKKRRKRKSKKKNNSID